MMLVKVVMTENLVVATIIIVGSITLIWWVVIFFRWVIRQHKQIQALRTSVLSRNERGELMNCPTCGTPMKATLRLTGGCVGGCDEFCYCDPPNAHVEFYCTKTGYGTYEQVKGESEWGFVKNRSRCKQKSIKIKELNCRVSIGRWFSDNYVPKRIKS